MGDRRSELLVRWGGLLSLARLPGTGDGGRTIPRRPHGRTDRPAATTDRTAASRDEAAAAVDGDTRPSATAWASGRHRPPRVAEFGRPSCEDPQPSPPAEPLPSTPPTRPIGRILIPRPPAPRRRRPLEPPPIVVDGIAHRPPAEQDPDIVGLSRLTRGKLGSRLFVLFFVLVYALIAGNLIYSLTHP